VADTPVRHRAAAEGNHPVADSHQAAVADSHQAAVAEGNHQEAVVESHPAAATEDNHHRAAVADSYRGEAEGWSAAAVVVVDQSWTPSNVDIRFIAALGNPN
jgi:hypothetical protein